ncbi:ImmA/IrrE family metallo-endopeptidase [Clostridium pasteurianum]|uniref:ImmA/IrrE family metallo-endopeptidase n=1 Tax=Clostridium pasteurianum TaxID=1501 RepID=UPI002260C4D2|nr:ImmA/IrrE family metallo-endopeptidase [Clostridium pasteurianum]UZW13236.1 ImmA/IrrE family metallo-endopeptidase [Clostridium pasteurianum]
MYEELASEIQAYGVDIIEMKFKGNHKGLYGDNVIAINKKIDTDKEKACVLAEEIGHHYTTYGNITDQSDLRNRKQEKRARNHAYEKLVGIVELINAFEAGIQGRYDLAEYLNVTESFLEYSIQHYREKYGIYFEIDNYIIYFEPNLYVMKAFK